MSSLAAINEKLSVNVSHLAMLLLKLAEMARKVQKTDKNTRLCGRGSNDILTLTARVNRVYL